MRRHVTIAKLAERHRHEERRLVLGALERNGWRLLAAAEQLGVGPSSLQRLIETHGLGETYAARNPGPGRPKTSAGTAT